MTGPPAPGSTPVHDPGYKDPVAEMQKRKEDEEAKARQMITSDLLSFCVYLLQSLLSLIIALIYYNSSEETDQQEEVEEIEEDLSAEEEKCDAPKKRYQKVMVANNVVDMFNSYKDAPTSPKKKDDLMTLIEKKQSDKIARPTEELLKAAKKNKMSQNEAKDINLQSMMYLS